MSEYPVIGALTAITDRFTAEIAELRDQLVERDATIQQQAAQIAVLRAEWRGLRLAVGVCKPYRIAADDDEATPATGFGYTFTAAQDNALQRAVKSMEQALADPNPAAERLVRLAVLMGDDVRLAAVISGLDNSQGAYHWTAVQLIAAINEAVKGE
jgi:hypothetical protein